MSSIILEDRRFLIGDECGGVMDRDVNGAKNIFLKNFEALGLSLALGPTPLLGGEHRILMDLAEFLRIF